MAEAEGLSSAGLSCADLVELVTEYLEDALDPRTRLRFEGHLAECEGCDIYLEQMRQTMKLLGRIPQETLSQPARERLLAAFRGWSDPPLHGC